MIVVVDSLCMLLCAYVMLN